MPGDDTADFEVYKAALCTTAAPVYFPIYNGHVDGGMLSRDPSLIACTRVKGAYENLQFSDIMLISIGAGSAEFQTQQINKVMDWGILTWSSLLFKLCFDSGLLTSEMIMKDVLDDNYYRMEPVLPMFIPFNDHNQTDWLINHGMNTDLTDCIAFLRKHF